MAGALAFIVGAPALAQAQQSGLFPLAPIQRQRTPCPMEDPVYRMYRQQYFGYHPTCWRRFPPGWGCPSPEAPNPAASFREIPRDKPPAALATEGQPPADGQPQPQPPPGSGEMEPGPVRPRNPQNPNNPNNLPPLPPTDRSPFDLDTKPTPPPGGNPPPGGPGPGLGAAEQPAAPETESASETETPIPMPASSTVPGGSASVEPSTGGEPLLALPDPTTGAPVPNLAPSGDPSVVANKPPTQNGFPTQAPKRPSLLSNLFSGLRRR